MPHYPWSLSQGNGPDGRLFIVEMVLPPGNVPHPEKLLDMGMLVMTGGRQRTEAEYGNLLDRTNFRLVNVVATEAPEYRGSRSGVAARSRR